MNEMSTKALRGPRQPRRGASTPDGKAEASLRVALELMVKGEQEVARGWRGKGLPAKAVTQRPPRTFAALVVVGGGCQLVTGLYLACVWEGHLPAGALYRAPSGCK